MEAGVLPTRNGGQKKRAPCPGAPQGPAQFHCQRMGHTHPGGEGAGLQTAEPVWPTQYRQPHITRPCSLCSLVPAAPPRVAPGEEMGGGSNSGAHLPPKLCVSFNHRVLASF